MDKSNSQLNQIPIHHRLLHLLQGVVAVLLMAMVLVYGLIISTNILTQLNHSETWFYIMTFLVCYLAIAFGIGVLYKQLIKNLRIFKAGTKSIE